MHFSGSIHGLFRGGRKEQERRSALAYTQDEGRKRHKEILRLDTDIKHYERALGILGTAQDSRAHELRLQWQKSVWELKARKLHLQQEDRLGDPSFTSNALRSPSRWTLDVDTQNEDGEVSNPPPTYAEATRASSLGGGPYYEHTSG